MRFEAWVTAGGSGSDCQNLGDHVESVLQQSFKRIVLIFVAVTGDEMSSFNKLHAAFGFCDGCRV